MTDLSDRTLRWALVLGVGCLAVPGSVADPTCRGYWTAETLRALAERVERVGMRISTLVLHNLSKEIVLGRPGRDEHIERVSRSIRAAGAAGCQVVEYSFARGPLSSQAGRWPTTTNRGLHTRREMLARLSRYVPQAVEELESPDPWEPVGYFLRAVTPAAEEAGVRLALHPDDSLPPTASGRGRVLERLAWLRRVRDLVPSKAHGVTLCQDCLGRRGINLVEAAHLLGGRGGIHHVHYRTPRRPPPRGDVWRDETAVDMLFGLKACRDVGYQGSLCPCRESAPGAALPVDLVDRSRAHGYIRALIRVASRL